MLFFKLRYSSCLDFKFLRFNIQTFRNITASGVHAPPARSTPPPTGNPGSATGECKPNFGSFSFLHCAFIVPDSKNYTNSMNVSL